MPSLRVCVVGSGPAGFYAASQVLKRCGELASVNIVDRLPTPYGLVRSGVAPDHQDTKNVINQFARVGEDSRVRFFGNVHVGSDIGLAELRKAHHAVVLAHGAESNRQLSIPGETLGHVLSAREFVGWYNGHPDFVQLPVDLSKVYKVAILGQGNVALDCARVLLQGAERLATTDIAEHAMQQLRSSPVREVSLIGRRGPVQASFTAKELRELLGLPDVRVVIDAAQLEAITPQDKALLQSSRAQRRIFDLMAKAAASPREDASKLLKLRFLESPKEVLHNGQGMAGGLALERNELVPGLRGPKAQGTGKMCHLEADLVLASIGYRCVPMPGAPFDEATGTIANREGRVLRAGSDEPDPGLYVTGWARRGPSGIIGTNLIDAQETVNAMLADLQQLPEPSGAPLAELLAQRSIKVVSFEDWLRIDAAERTAGLQLGRPRLKLTSLQAMQDLLSSSPPQTQSSTQA